MIVDSIDVVAQTSRHLIGARAPVQTIVTGGPGQYIAHRGPHNECTNFVAGFGENRFEHSESIGIRRHGTRVETYLCGPDGQDGSSRTAEISPSGQTVARYLPTGGDRTQPICICNRIGRAERLPLGGNACD